MVTAQHIDLGGRRIGAGLPCFVIAEAGVNHNGDLALAQKLVDAAADAGADAVKFQTFDAARLAAADAPQAEYQAREAKADSQRAMLEKLQLSREAHIVLKRQAQARGILFMSSPFEEGSADLLDALDVPAFKIASGELTNHPFLAHVAKKGRPMLISTGMATLDEVKDALAEIARVAPTTQVALFHCVSSYPARAQDANLRAMATLAATFGVPVGWSDHIERNEISFAAVALGASLIEKHLTLDRTLAGPDHKASLEPAQFSALVDGIRAIESSLGTGDKRPVASELPIAAVARKSLYFRRALTSGHVLTADDLVALRPGTGVSPARARSLVGKKLARAVTEGQRLHDTDVEALP